MADIEKIREKLSKFAHDSQWYGAEKALIGAIIDGVETVQAPGRPGWVNVRIQRTSGVSSTVAINTKVQATYGLEVWVGTNPEGQLAVIDIVEQSATLQHGNSAPYLRYPSAITSGLIRARRFMPGLCTTHKVSGAYTMQVYVHPFAYNYDSKLQYWYGGTIDLTANIPATSNTHRFVLVGVDPTTNSLDYINGAEYPLSSNLGISAAREIDPEILIPSACVEIKYGMSAIDSGKYFFDVRPLVTGVMTQFVKDLDDSKIDNPLGGGEVLRYNGSLGMWEAINLIFDPKLTPASPNALDDEFDDGSIDAAWHDSGDYVGPGTFNPHSTWEEENGIIRAILDHPTGATYGNSDVRTKTLPAGNFTIVTRCRVDRDLETFDANIYYGAGLVLYRNEALLNNSAHAFGISFVGSYEGIGATEISFSTSTVIPIDDAGVTYEKNTWMYFRVRRSSTTYYFDYSYDGITWINSYSGNPFSNAPNEVGIGIFNGDSTNITLPLTAEFDFFRYHGSFDAVTDPLLGNRLFLDIATYDSDQDGLIDEAGNADTVDNLHASAFVQDADYDANSILAATSDNTPAVVTVASNTVIGRAGGNIDDLAIGEDTVLGRLTGANIAALTIAQMKTLLGLNSHAARAVRSASTQSISDSTLTVVNFDSVEYDLSSAITTGAAWQFRCPEAGKYRVSAMVTMTPNTEFQLGNVVRLMLYKEGVLYSWLDQQAIHDPTNHAVAMSGSDTIDCALNDDLDIRMYQASGATLAISNSAGVTHVAIEKVQG